MILASSATVTLGQPVLFGLVCMERDKERPRTRVFVESDSLPHLGYTRQVTRSQRDVRPARFSFLFNGRLVFTRLHSAPVLASCSFPYACQILLLVLFIIVIRNHGNALVPSILHGRVIGIVGIVCIACSPLER